MRECTVCSVELIPGDNWAASRVKKGDAQCKPCQYQRNLFCRNERYAANPVKEKCKEMRRSSRARAYDKKIGFNLTVAYLESIAPEICPVFGTRLVYDCDRGNPYVASLDRIVPQLGYVKGNVQIISFLANQMKSNATADQLEQFADWVKKSPISPVIVLVGTK